MAGLSKYCDPSALLILNGSPFENLASSSREEGNHETIFIELRRGGGASGRFNKMPTKMSGMEFWRLDFHDICNPFDLWL